MTLTYRLSIEPPGERKSTRETEPATKKKGERKERERAIEGGKEKIVR